MVTLKAAIQSNLAVSVREQLAPVQRHKRHSSLTNMLAINSEIAKPRRKRVIADVLAPLKELAGSSSSLIAAESGKFVAGSEGYELPRYLFIGPKGGGDTIRIGLFAGLHGDEPEGVHAVIRFLQLLEAEPQLATGYCLFIYPVCNPTGFEDRTRGTRAAAKT